MDITVYPPRLQTEPLSLVAFDSWQDWEGQQDASRECRAAWLVFQSGWKRQRRIDLARELPAEDVVSWLDTLDKPSAFGARRARALGSAWAMCRAEQKRKPLTSDQRAAWFRWRSRVTRADLTVWQALWALIDGDELADVAARFDTDPERLGLQCAMVLRWLVVELYPASIR